MLSALEWTLMGAASAAAIIYGVWRYRPARIGPWILLGCSVLTLSAGDVCFALDDKTVADLFYTAMFLFVALCVSQLTRVGTVLLDRARLIDMVAFATSAMLLVWVFVLGSGPLSKLNGADVLGDLLLVGIAGYLVVVSWRNWSALLLAVGALGVLAGDVLYPFFPGAGGEIGYMVLYLAWGGAALHPSMAALTAPVQIRQTPWHGRWAALLAVAVAIPPLVLLLEGFTTDSVTNGVVIAAAGCITLAMTFTRLGDSLRQHSAALTRERGLREASAALVAAADVPAVDEAVRAAAAQLLPGLRKVVFTTDDRQLTLPPGESGPSPRSWWITGEVPGCATLVCPLWLEPLAVARPNGGALVLTGDRDLLSTARDALEVLAGQAALALDRISLVEAVGRRDSDLYLRAVIRNTADAMLVIDSDQRIRYASPALRDLLGGAELPPLATLEDLVHPDDRSEVREALRSHGDGVVFCALQREDQTQVLVEATYRDLRDDRLVQGFVVTMRNVTTGHEPGERLPELGHQDELPAWVNRRSAQHKFRY